MLVKTKKRGTGLQTQQIRSVRKSFGQSNKVKTEEKMRENGQLPIKMADINADWGDANNGCFHNKTSYLCMNETNTLIAITYTY
ncbi:hypothetical protein [Hafnia alvei]|uniref:hypothetical protein n=1 Tax=Hafnia alvei TaxID=569 RepID=UPI0009314EB8|nr:hypothetical protein [Hafnia alvei]NLS53184.1 hypothetical protein [Hafnia alvei]